MEYNFDENPLRLLMDNILEIISRWDQMTLPMKKTAAVYASQCNRLVEDFHTPFPRGISSRPPMLANSDNLVRERFQTKEIMDQLAKLGIIQWCHNGAELRVFLTNTSWHSFIGLRKMDDFLDSSDGKQCMQTLGEIEMKLKIFPLGNSVHQRLMAVFRRLEWLLGTHYGESAEVRGRARRLNYKIARDLI